MKKNTGTNVLPVDGFVEMTADVIEQVKEAKFQNDIDEIKNDIPNAIKKKTDEVPEDERGQLQYMVDNGILPSSVLDTATESEKVAAAPTVTTDAENGEDEEVETDTFVTPTESNLSYNPDEDWDTGLAEDDEAEKEDPAITTIEDYEIVESTNDVTVFRTFIHDKPVLTKVENKKLESITDAVEFDRFLIEQRKKYRDKITMPLINSGIVAEFIGAGAFDYSDIYATDPDTITIVDTLNRMKVMVKNIVDVEPKMSGKKLLSNISYTDYQLASLGFAAATIPDIDVPAVCEHDECNTSFIIRTKTVDTVLNATKINDKWIEISKIPVKDRVFKRTATVDYFEGYISIAMEIPNFEKVKTTFAAIEQAVNNKTVDAGIRAFATLIINVDHIMIDNVIVTEPINIYKMIKSMSTEEINVLQDAAGKLYEGIVVPEFGVRANCPKCGKENTIQIGTVDEMVFYHLWARRTLNTVKLAKKNMKTGSSNS